MREPLLKARELLRDVTPLKTDCGLMCGHACCACDEDGQGGVWLLEEEEEQLKARDWVQIIPDGDINMLMCRSLCDRDMRPFFCRIFPLIGVVRKGKWDVRMDRRAWAVCPLMSGGIRGLDPQFVSAAREAVTVLAADEAYEKALRKWARLERAFAECDLWEDAHDPD